MNLYSVEIEKTILVLADDERKAIREANYHQGEEESDFEYVKEIKKLKDLQDEWKDSVPYGSKDEKTCKEIVEGYEQDEQQIKEENERIEKEREILKNQMSLFDKPKKPASVIIVQNDNDEILLLNRTSSPSGWCVPGGKIDKGESELDAAIRELFEETNISIESDNIKKVGNSASADGRQIAVFFTLVENQTKVQISKEHTGYMWVKGSFSEIKLAGNTKKFLEFLKNK